MPFVSARLYAPKKVLYRTDDDRYFLRISGSRSWRTFNPGNIKFGSFTDAHGAIGNDGLQAVFPDQATGREAMGALLKTASYRSRSITGAIARWAPESDGNPTPAYVAFVAERVGVDPSTKIEDLSAAQLRKMVAAMEVFEGWREGTVEEIEIASPSGADGVAHAAVAGAVPKDAIPASPASASAAKTWMEIAKTESELPAKQRSQWPDPGENPRILKYFAEAVGAWFTDDDKDGDETDWCAAFVNWCLKQAGFDGTEHPGARSFFWPNSKFIKSDEPMFGSVVVFRDPASFSDSKWRSGTGHVGFVVSWTKPTNSHPGMVIVLGGNQGGTVKIQEMVWRPKSEQNQRRVECFVRPVKD